jgi:phosphatidylserine decarboxylase
VEGAAEQRRHSVRQLSILDTKHFGTVGFVEIGAMTVGRIVQVHPLDQRFERGAEKSFFCFWGFGHCDVWRPGRWRPSEDILAQTRKSTETLIRLGEVVALANAE